MFEALFGGSQPTLQQAGLDPGTQKQIKSAVADAGLSDKDLAAKYNAGVSEAGNQALQTEGQMGQRAAQTGENNSMLQAIRNQYRAQGQNKIGSVIRSNNMNLPFQRAHSIDLATKAVFAQKQVDTQNNIALMQANNDAEIARANALYGVLSGAGTLAGAYIGGRMKGGVERPYTPTDQTINEFNGPSFSSVEGGMASRVPNIG